MYEEYQKGIPAVWVILATYAVGLAAVGLCAGTFVNPWLWVFLGIHAAFLAVYSLMLKGSHPQVFARNWSTDFEKPHVCRCLIPACVLAVVSAVVSTLDVYRFGWSPLPIVFSFIGTGIAIAAYMLAVQCLMAVPPHAEEHYGEERGTAEQYGPYSVLRHPMAVAAALMGISVPLMIGSLVGLIPVAGMIVFLVIYTNSEDNWRFANYDWYFDYMKTVAYRMIPMIW